MNKIKTPSKQYFNNCISQNLNLLNVFSIVMAALCLLLWLDNETPIFPLTFKIELNYYNITGSFFILYLLSWALIKVSAAYKQLQFLTYWIIIVISFGFLDGMGILELNRGNGLTPLALGYVTLAVIISTRLQVLTSFFLINSAFFYYLIVQTANVEDPHNKMALFTITILSIMIFITVEKHRRKEYETRKMLAKKIEELNRALDVKSVCFGHMSHELRTPLNAIIGFSEILMKEDDYKVDQERREEYLGYIFEAGSSLMTMVTDIQQISRLESAEAGLQDEELDVGDEILGCVRALDLRASDEGVQVECSIQDDLPYLRTNAQGFKQIIVNLLSNAIHFTPREGRIDITVLQDTYSGLSIRFSDTGVGIKEEDLPFITDPFWKADEEAEERSGLGLSIVKAIIERNQGSLSIESEPDRGTSVTINFPSDRLIDRGSLLQ